jgi:hypothetical protein
MIQETKVCSGCKIEKPKSEYWKRKDRPNGVYSRCIKCSSKSYSQWHSENKYSVRRRNACRNYNLTYEQYDAMHNRGCEACGSKEELCVDHDHSCCNGEFSCGKCVRGMLCKGCNVAEGWLNGDPQRAILLSEYMKRFL